jgi:hypothetical protein
MKQVQGASAESKCMKQVHEASAGCMVSWITVNTASRKADSAMPQQRHHMLSRMVVSLRAVTAAAQDASLLTPHLYCCCCCWLSRQAQRREEQGHHQALQAGRHAGMRCVSHSVCAQGIRM